MQKFWDSEANKFTLYGAIFGILFPIIATIIEALQMGGITLSNIIAVQSSDPLLWIIDSAPFFLGLFARFAGWRQDQLKQIIRDHELISDQVKDDLEDSQQFAGLLTFLAAGLLSVVLFLIILWLQSLITSRIQSIATGTPTMVESVGVASAPTSVPTVLVVTDTPVTTNTPELVAPTATSAPPTATEITVENTPTPTYVPAATAVPTVLETTAIPTEAAPTQEVPAPASETTVEETTLRLGVLERDEIDCMLPTAVTALSWQEFLGIDITIESFSSADALFASLNDIDAPEHINLTLCYLDPNDRQYVRQYAGQIEIVGNAYLTTADTKLFAIRSQDSVVPQANIASCIDRYLENQVYTTEELAGTDAATWFAANRDLVRSWLGCADE